MSFKGTLFLGFRLLIVPAICMALMGGSVRAADNSEIPEVPKGKETTLGLYVTSKEAYEAWVADPDKVTVIDVRTTEEFIFIGHPEMAWNIPAFVQSYEWDSDKGHFKMKPNPDFVSEVKELFQPSGTIMVTCRSGSRSAMAANMLAEAGFTQVFNIVDGVEGEKVTDPESLYGGQRLVNGWKNSGIPWTYHLDPERMVLPEVQ